MGANNAVEMLEVAKQECGRLERENAKLKRNNFVYAEAFNVLAAERDAALAVRDELVMLIRTSPAEWSTSEGVDIIVRGVEEREMNEALAKSPTQSLAKHDAGIRAAERDGLLAIITAASLAAADSYRDDRNFGHDGSPYYNGGKHMAGIMRGILTTSPAQSLANLQAALVLEYIDGPEHAESLREVRCEVFRGLAGYFGQSDGSTWKDSLLAQMMREEAEKISKTTESETNHE